MATFFVVLFITGLGVACFWPSIQSYAANELNVDSTMLLILLSAGGIPGFGLATWVMGVIADRVSIEMSFVVIPAFFALLMLVFIFAARSLARRR
jgi:fucose permease